MLLRPYLSLISAQTLLLLASLSCLSGDAEGAHLGQQLLRLALGEVLAHGLEDSTQTKGIST